MDVERIRAFLLTLPHAVETMKWGANLVFWVGDKAIGGKMFALINLDQAPDHAKPQPVISYPAGAERYAELLETEGILPAPYMARIFWVAGESWSVFRPAEWEQQLRFAHQLTFSRLPPKTKSLLALPATQQKRLITERRKLLAAKAPKPKKKSP